MQPAAFFLELCHLDDKVTHIDQIPQFTNFDINDGLIKRSSVS